MEILRKSDRRNSLYMAMEIKRLSLNSEGAFLTTIHSLIPQIRKITSTEIKQEKNVNITNLVRYI